MESWSMLVLVRFANFVDESLCSYRLVIYRVQRGGTETPVNGIYFITVSHGKRGCFDWSSLKHSVYPQGPFLGPRESGKFPARPRFVDALSKPPGPVLGLSGPCRARGNSVSRVIKVYRMYSKGIRSSLKPYGSQEYARREKKPSPTDCARRKRARPTDAKKFGVQPNNIFIRRSPPVDSAPRATEFPRAENSLLQPIRSQFSQLS